jgi:hypothetical protein
MRVSSPRGVRVLVALALALVASMLAPAPASAVPSSYSKSPTGTRVLFHFLEDLGYRPRRIFSAAELDEKTDLLVLLGPANDAMAVEVLAWAMAGRTIVLAPPLSSEDGTCTTTKFGSIPLERSFSLKGFLKDALAPSRVPDAGASAGPAPKAPPRSRTTEADLDLEASPCLLLPTGRARAVAGASTGAVAMELPVQKGRMLVLAHDFLLANELLDRDDIAVLLRRWLARNAPPPARVAFLEERLGGDLLKTLREARLSLFVLHGVAILLLLYLVLAPRSADPPAAEAPSTRRAFSQHARALGHLYERRGASVFVLARQVERFLARFAGASEARRGAEGAPPGEPARARLAALVATRTGKDPDAIESLLAQVDHALAPRGAEAEAGANVQRHYRLSQSLAALQRSARDPHRGGPRGR